MISISRRWRAILPGPLQMCIRDSDVDRTLLLRALERLPARERQIISMRFGINMPEAMTQKEVADLLGISQSYISRLEKRIIARMRKDILKWV